MKFPIFNRFISLNLFIYAILLWGLSFVVIFLMTITLPIIPIWLLFIGIFIVLHFIVIPISLFLVALDFVLCKFKILKYKNYVNVSARTNKIIYTLVFCISILYVLYEFYFYPLLEKNSILD